eukprot:scaffold14791_cov57-Phaeocystis_antarctica.AAC.1
MATLATLDRFRSFIINRSNPSVASMLTKVLLADSTVPSAWLTNEYGEIHGDPPAMGQRSSKARPSAAKRGVACPQQWLPVLMTTASPSYSVQYTPNQAVEQVSTFLSKPLSKPLPPSPSPPPPSPSPLPAIDTSIKEEVPLLDPLLSTFVLRSDANSEELADDHAEEQRAQRRSLVSPESEDDSLPPPMPPSQPLTVAASRRLSH